MLGLKRNLNYKDDQSVLSMWQLRICGMVAQLIRTHQFVPMQEKKIASAQARQTGEEVSDVTRHLYQRMAVLLAMGNAAMLLNR